MNNISKNDFQKKHRMNWQNFLWEKFLEYFPDNRSREILNTIFSEYEKKLITKRLTVMALIKEGMGTKEIHRLLWLSRSTISALKKVFLQKSTNYKSQRSLKKFPEKINKKLIKVAKDDWFDIFLGIDLLDLIKNPPRPVGMGFKKSKV